MFGGLAILLACQLRSFAPRLCRHGNKEYYKEENQTEVGDSTKRRVIVHGNLDIAPCVLTLGHVGPSTRPRTNLCG